MNIKNALSFFILGLLMHTVPMLTQSLSDQAATLAEASVRSVWVQFMSWVIGGIGLGCLTREGLARLPAMLTSILPERLLRPVEAKSESLQLPAGSRVGASN